MSLIQILLALVNVLHLILFVVFLWWAYLLHKDVKKGNNGITRSLRKLVVLKDLSAEFWSLVVVSMTFFEFYVPFRAFAVGFRLLQLLATVYAVSCFVKAYRKELNVDN